MKNNNPYWSMFEDTGDIEAYLLYKEYQNRVNEEFGKEIKVDYDREGYGDNNP